jgi:hypothetical protein
VTPFFLLSKPTQRVLGGSTTDSAVGCPFVNGQRASCFAIGDGLGSFLGQNAYLAHQQIPPTQVSGQFDEPARTRVEQRLHLLLRSAKEQIRPIGNEGVENLVGEHSAGEDSQLGQLKPEILALVAQGQVEGSLVGVTRRPEAAFEPHLVGARLHAWPERLGPNGHHGRCGKNDSDHAVLRSGPRFHTATAADTGRVRNSASRSTPNQDRASAQAETRPSGKNFVTVVVRLW